MVPWVITVSLDRVWWMVYIMFNWSWVKSLETQTAKHTEPFLTESPLLGSSQRSKGRLYLSWNWKEPVQVVRAFDRDASWAPSFGGFSGFPTGRRPQGRPRTGWRDYISHLAWECLGIPPEELENVAGERDVWTTLAGCHYDTAPDKQQKMNVWMDAVFVQVLLCINEHSCSQPGTIYYPLLKKTSCSCPPQNWKRTDPWP